MRNPRLVRGKEPARVSRLAWITENAAQPRQVDVQKSRLRNMLLVLPLLPHILVAEFLNSLHYRKQVDRELRLAPRRAVTVVATLN